MVNLLKGYIGLSNRLIGWAGNVVSWLTAILVLVICYDVVMRYLFNSSSVAIYEIEWHIFALIFLLGAGFALKHDKHVRVDVFYSRFPEKTRAWVNLAGTTLLLFPFCIILITEGFDFVANSFRLSESSPDPGGLPARYLIKAAIPVGMGLLLIQAVSLACQSVLTIIEPKQTPDQRD
ncbi:MAG: C4-dicarboxylate ABC transporter [Cyclobacteriaceae bacterium]|nr:MAG: C4-dicarboxylate ABC transporter [Cyclobacteriaceae bacterium]